MADAWINTLYSFLNTVGFVDPVHAPLVHVPMGLVIGFFAACLSLQCCCLL